MSDGDWPLPAAGQVPHVDPARAVRLVQYRYRLAAWQISQSWPGSDWGADYRAAQVAAALAICAEAGLDITPLLNQWDDRYYAYRGRGGRAKFRSIGRPLQNPRSTPP